MPRPKRVSDEAILDAAARLLFDGGSAQFTLSDVAAAVGIARATLIQRFDNRETILRKVAERQVFVTAQYLDGMPLKRGRDGLWQFLETIIGDMGDGDNFGVHVELAWLESTDAKLRRYAADRYALVQVAMAARMPDTVAQSEKIAAHLHAVIAGATMQWVAGRDGSLNHYVLNQLKFALSQIRELAI